MNNYTIDYEKCENCGGEWIQVDYKGLKLYVISVEDKNNF